MDSIQRATKGPSKPCVCEAGKAPPEALTHVPGSRSAAWTDKRPPTSGQSGGGRRASSELTSGECCSPAPGARSHRGTPLFNVHSQGSGEAMFSRPLYTLVDWSQPSVSCDQPVTRHL